MAQDHFKKHFVQKDRVDWNFNVLFGGQEDARRMANEYAPLLDHPELYEPIPFEWLHSTILRVGLVDDFTESEMLAVADLLALKLANLDLPEFIFDSWWIWGGNVCLHITPHDQYSKIYDCVIEALEAVVDGSRTNRTPHGSFIPHVTLVYTKRHNQERKIHDKLVRNPVAPAAFTATHLSLIKQRPKNGHYEWEVVKKHPHKLVV